jgi:cytochrome c
LGVIVVLFFTACGNDGEKNAPGAETSAEEAKETTSTAATTNNLSQDPVYKKGLSLIAKSDCLTCHKIDEKLVGPTYRDVAEKYAGAPNDVITALANKIIKGGVGNWGNVPMLPHPAISQDDAETMVRYILMLKK